jgi:hypothetical protein
MSIPGARSTVHAARCLWNIIRSCRSPFLRTFPAGHFYSPLPDMSWVTANEACLFDLAGEKCIGVEMHDDRQLEILNEMSAFYDEIQFPEQASPAFRYFFRNPILRIRRRSRFVRNVAAA